MLWLAAAVLWLAAAMWHMGRYVHALYGSGLVMQWCCCCALPASTGPAAAAAAHPLADPSWADPSWADPIDIVSYLPLRVCTALHATRSSPVINSPQALHMRSDCSPGWCLTFFIAFVISFFLALGRRCVLLHGVSKPVCVTALTLNGADELAGGAVGAPEQHWISSEYLCLQGVCRQVAGCEEAPQFHHPALHSLVKAVRCMGVQRCLCCTAGRCIGSGVGRTWQSGCAAAWGAAQQRGM
jgi:hypothetical protein